MQIAIFPVLSFQPKWATLNSISIQFQNEYTHTTDDVHDDNDWLT